MKLLAEISEGSLGLGESEQLNTEYRLRKSARAILCNSEGNIAVQFLKNYNFHKLPGGGVDPGESTEEALHREVLEEVGCECDINSEVGVVIEYRNKQNLLHISYCFAATVKGEVGETQLEEKEIGEGQETIWIPPEEALAKMKKDVPEKFSGHFILEREINHLEEYIKQQN